MIEDNLGSFSYFPTTSLAQCCLYWGWDTTDACAFVLTWSSTLEVSEHLQLQRSWWDCAEGTSLNVCIHQCPNSRDIGEPVMFTATRHGHGPTALDACLHVEPPVLMGLPLDAGPSHHPYAQGQTLQPS